MSAKWTAIAWTRHSTTSVVVDDPSFITGRRVVAECEDEDEARLVSAAPELLAALKRIDEWNRRTMDSGLPAPRGITESHLADVRAAISRATGSAAA